MLFRSDLSFLPDLASSKTTAQINKINLSIDELIKKAKDLSIAVSKHKNYTITQIKNHQNDINEFMSYAGYSYNVAIENKNEDYKLRLFHNDFKD